LDPLPLPGFRFKSGLQAKGMTIDPTKTPLYPGQRCLQLSASVDAQGGFDGAAACEVETWVDLTQMA
jgi:hypothetical protein